MAEPTTTASPLFWLTDRTRWETGTGRCPRRRYLSTSFGPTGYGIASSSESLPLVTGQGAHDGFEGLCRILMTDDRLPTLEETRAVVQAAQDRYLAKVETRGYLGILAGPATEETIAEQRVLISGLVWALRVRFLPWLHANYRLLSIEEERLKVLSCTCGAGSLAAAIHIDRGCQGIALQLRRDCLAERRGTKTLAYFEVKTTGWESDAWAEQWETKPQLGIGTLDTEQQWPGQEVTEIYIVGLNKGRRVKDRYEEVVEGEVQRKKQQSPLCYGYARPGNPPLMTEDWLPAYQWTTADGTIKRASRQHRRKGVWELVNSDWPTWIAHHTQDPAMSPEEFWVRNLPDSLLDKVCFVLGPMNRQDAQLVSVLTSMTAEEERWQAIAWEVYEAQQGIRACDCAGGDQGEGLVSIPHEPQCASLHPRPLTWSSPEFQALLDRLAPCAWTCRPYGREHQCAFVPICHRQTGWDDPLATGRYKPRRPHHDPELQQAIGRGLLIEQAEDAVDEEDRDA